MPTITSPRRPALLATFACAGALIAAPTAHASGVTYRVVKASSTSHDTYADSSEHGDSTTHWKLRHKGHGVPNGGSLQRTPVGSIGLVRFNVGGVYTTDLYDGSLHKSCSVTAPTGSSEYPLVAPETGMVAFAAKAKAKRILVSFQVPMASIGNPYTECGFSDDPAPELEAFTAKYSARMLMHKRRFTLKSHGSRPGYTWKISVTLERVVHRKHRS
jgi:hypothetical protein